MSYLSKRRDELEVIRSILEAASNELSLTRTAMHSSSNYKHVWRIVLVLQKKGLIKVIRTSKKKQLVVLTQRGQLLRKLLDSFQYCLYSLESCTSGNPGSSNEKLAEKAHGVVEFILFKKRRSHMEIYFIILASLVNAPKTISSIANKCYLNIEHARQYIEELKSSNMIEEFTSESDRKMYRITNRGLQFITLYLEIYELIYGTGEI